MDYAPAVNKDTESPARAVTKALPARLVEELKRFFMVGYLN
jgi:hypothetical protein